MSIQLKRYSTSYWNSNNPILKNGEVGLEEVSPGIFKFKIGTESTAWNSLYYPVVFTVGDNSFSGVQNLNSGILKNPIFQNYAESVINASISNSGLTVNISSGNVFKIDLNSNITGVVITGAYPSGNSHCFTFVFNYINSGMSISWPSNVYWSNGSGSVPTIGSGVGRSAIMSFMTYDGGSTYYGFLGGSNFGV